MEILEKRKERIKIFLEKGYTVNLESGKVFNSWNKECKFINKFGYNQLCTLYNGKRIRMMAHQLIYFVHTGKVVECIDHINNNKSDNRIKNLREVTISENRLNDPTVKGYYYSKDRKKYLSIIKINNKQYEVGSFDSTDEATKCYLFYKEKFHKINGEINQKEFNTFLEIKKIKGVTLHKNNKWQARISINGKSKSLGYFFKKEDAMEAYQKEKNKVN